MCFITRMTAPVKGQVVLLKLNSRLHPATVVNVNSGDNVNLVVNSDGISPWDDGFGTDAFQYPIRVYTSADKGSGTGEWQEASVLASFASETYVDTAVSGLASETYVDSSVSGLATTANVSSAVSGLASTASVTSAISTAVSSLATTSAMTAAISAAIAAIPADDDSGLTVVPAAGASTSLALATPRRPSTTRPTRVTVYGSIALPTALLAAQGATVEMRADSAATPTTVVGGPLTAASGVGNVGTLNLPWMMTYDLPANHYYSIVQSATTGTGVVSITHINETVA